MSKLVCGVGTNRRGEFPARIGPRGASKITPAYHCWANMLKRCYNPSDSQYHNYGAKGIRVCDEWLEFQVFAKWFYAQDWKDKRLDKDKTGSNTYCPDSCQFLTNQENTELALAKHYTFVSPEGQTTKIYNLPKFCRDNPDLGLNSSSMSAVYRGKRDHHKGWTKHVKSV